jgi:hypothetical protein
MGVVVSHRVARICIAPELAIGSRSMQCLCGCAYRLCVLPLYRQRHLRACVTHEAAVL